MKRLLLILLFSLLFCASAFATTVTVASDQFGNYTFSGSTAKLRIWPSTSFVTSDSRLIFAGSANALYQGVNCTVSGRVATCDQFTIDSTTDSSVTNATYTAALYDSTGRFVATVLAGFRVPASPTSTTWADLKILNSAAPAPLSSRYLTADQTNALIGAGNDVKTINGQSIKGNGDILLQTPLVSGSTIKTVNSTSLLGSGNVAVQPTLVSGTNLKTVNSTTLLGSGDLAVQPTLVSGTNIKTVNGSSLLGSGNVAVGSASLANTYGNDLSAAIAAIGSTPTLLQVDAGTSCSTALTVPSTLTLQFTNDAAISNSGGCTIAFQGFGLYKPDGLVGIFGGFSPGNITWTGANYPDTISANLWKNSDVAVQIHNADAAFLAKKVTIKALPGNIASGPTTLTAGHSLHLTAGTYTDIWNYGGNVNQPVLYMADNTAIYGDGIGRTIWQTSSTPGTNNVIWGSGLDRSLYFNADGPNNNLTIKDFTIRADINKVFQDTGGATILLGNVNGGLVSGMQLQNTTGYGIFSGAFGTLGYYANNVIIRNNIFDYVRSQNTGTVNGKNITITGNVFTNINISPLVRTITSVSKTGGSNTVTAAAGTGNFTSADVARRVEILDGGGNVVIDGRVASVTNTDQIVVSTYYTGSTASSASAQQMRIRNDDGFVQAIDCEPNSFDNLNENIVITSNTFDGSNSYQNWSGIALQSGIFTGENHVVVSNNIIRGNSAGHLVTGINLTGGSNNIVHGNIIERSVANGITLDGVGHSTISNNHLRLAGVFGGIRVKSSAKNFFVGNVLDAWSEDSGAESSGSGDIIEAESLSTEMTVNTSTTGNTVTRVSGTPFPQTWWKGRTVTINGVDYVVASVIDYVTFTLTTNPGNQTGVGLATKFSDNTYSNNKRNSITLLGTSVEYSRMDAVAATATDITNLQTQVTDLSTNKLDATDLLRAYQATDATYNNTAALANTDLSVTVAGGGYYKVEAVVHGTNAVKALNMDFGGTCTVTQAIGEWTSYKATGALGAGDSARVTSVATNYSNAGLDTFDSYYVFKGQVRIGAGGTFVLKAAQRTADVSNTKLLADSNLVLTRVFTAPFDPTQVAGLYQWLDAQTLGLADGTAVGTWTDSSGNGRNATQATGANKPTYKTNIVNGKNVVRFDGVNDYLSLGNFSALTAGEAFVVVKTTADPSGSASTGGLWDIGTDSATTHFTFTSDGVIYDQFGTNGRKTTVNPSTSLSSNFVVYSVYSASGDWANFINGGTALFSTGTNTAAFTSAAFLGAGQPTGSANWLSGDIAEFIMYSNKLSSSDRAAVIAYLRAKYAL